MNLCNVRYKIISKILVNGLRLNLTNCISDMQEAFLLGKITADNIAVAKEVLHVMSQSSRNKKYYAIKVDVQNAYDKFA